MEGKYLDINTDDSSFHDYYIIKFSAYPYILQADLSIDGQVISSCEMVFEVTYFFPVNTNSQYYVLQITKYINTIVSLSKILNGSVKVI